MGYGVAHGDQSEKGPGGAQSCRQRRGLRLQAHRVGQRRQNHQGELMQSL